MNSRRTLRVVRVGGGFAGLQAVRGLRHAPVEVTLVDRENLTLLQPLEGLAALGARVIDDLGDLNELDRRRDAVQVGHPLT
jgi:NADH dehydrogenase FAD-containing subunit